MSKTKKQPQVTPNPAGKSEDYVQQRNHVPPKKLEAFPFAEKVKRKNLERARWRDTVNRYIYEFDNMHNTVERFTFNGEHQGEFNHKTGEQTGPANPARNIEI